jgi:hypothetical protein
VECLGREKLEERRNTSNLKVKKFFTATEALILQKTQTKTNHLTPDSRHQSFRQTPP